LFQNVRRHGEHLRSGSTHKDRKGLKSMIPACLAYIMLRQTPGPKRRGQLVRTGLGGLL
jgi:hypothetical protein